MDQDTHHQSIKEDPQLPATEDEQRVAKDHFLLQNYPSSSDGPVDLSPESSECVSRTQLPPQSDYSIEASSGGLDDENVEILSERTSYRTTLGTDQDINSLLENLCSHTENVVESDISSQNVGASALERQIFNEPLRDCVAAGERTQDDRSKAPGQLVHNERPADNLQEFISKYSTVFHTIISDFRNFVKIVELFTGNPKVLLGIVQIFIDNPEVLRCTSQNAESTQQQLDRLPLNQLESNRGLSELDRNSKNVGESAMPNSSKLPSIDVGFTGGDLNADINLLTRFYELKDLLLHLLDRNDQGTDDKSGTDRTILESKRTITAARTFSLPINNLEDVALERSDESEIEPPSQKRGDSSEEPQLEFSRRLSDYRKQSSENRSDLPAALDENIEQHRLDCYATKDSIAEKKSQQSELELPSQEIEKSSEVQQSDPTGEESSEDPQTKPCRKPLGNFSYSNLSVSAYHLSADQRDQISEVKDGLPTVVVENIDPHHADRILTRYTVPAQIPCGGEGVIKWFFKPIDDISLDVDSDFSISDNRGHSAILQTSEELEIESPSRKAKDSSKEPQSAPNKKPSDHQKQSSEDRSILLPAPDANVEKQCTDRYSTKDSAAEQKFNQLESDFLPQNVEEFSEEQQQPKPSGERVIKWTFKPIDSRSLDVPSGSSSSEHSTRKDIKSLEDIYSDKNEPQDSPELDCSQSELSKRPSEKLQQSELEFPLEEIGEPSAEHQPGSSGETIQWFSKPPESENLDIPGGSSTYERPASKDVKSEEHIQADDEKPQRSCHVDSDQPGPSRRPSRNFVSVISSVSKHFVTLHNRKHAAALEAYEESQREHGSEPSATPDENIEQHSTDPATGQKSPQSKSEFPPQQVGKSSTKKQSGSSEMSLPSQFQDLVTEEVVKWFFNLTNSTISAIDSDSSSSERPVHKYVKPRKHTHKHKKESQDSSHLAFDQPGPSRRFSDNREISISRERSSDSEIDFPPRKVAQSSEVPQPEHSRRPSDYGKHMSRDKSTLAAAADENVRQQCTDHYSGKDSVAGEKSHELELEISLQQVGESSKEQRPESIEERPSSPSTDLLTDEIVKWFFQLNNSIKPIVQSDPSSAERLAREDVTSSGSTHKHEKGRHGPCDLTFDEPGSSKRPSEDREQISTDRSSSLEAPGGNVEQHCADLHSTKDSAAIQRSHKSELEFPPQEVGESSEKQQIGSNEGCFPSPSTDLLIGEVVNDSERSADKDPKGLAPDEDHPSSAPEEKLSPQLLNVGNVNELLGHLNAPPISTTPCDMCHLRPMQFEELNFWYQLQWKLIVDGRERTFESQAKPIFLVNPIEADQYFQEIKSKMPNPGDDPDRAHQKQSKYKKGRKEKKRNF